MYCNKCGKEIEADSPFCPYCGAPVSGTPESSAGSGKKKNAILIIVGIIAVAVIAAAGYLLYDNSRTITVDLGALSTEPEYAGFNGEGELLFAPMIDESKLNDLINGTEERNRDALIEFISTVSFKAEPTKSLSNDDVIAITASFDAETAENDHVEVTNVKKEYTVQGLEERPKDVSVADVRDSGIVSRLWDSLNYMGIGFEGAYFGTSSSDHKIFLIAYDEDFDEDDELIKSYYIENTNGFKSELTNVFINTEEIYGQSPKTSVKECLDLIRTMGYSVEKI